MGRIRRFHHVSTDEVYGSLGPEGRFREDTPYHPNSPYSASKASSDHFVRAYHHTYGLPVVLTNCSNNYGPRQYPEKLIPVVVRSLAEGRPIPVYGAGANVRDWLYVGDHVLAMDAVFHNGRNGETYILLYDDANERETRRCLGRMAMDPRLSFTWVDAARLAATMRRRRSAGEV